jgi:predicted glycosyltransferase
MSKILVYSHDTFGLGNIRRMLEISRFLVDRQDNLSILIVSGSPLLHAFRIPPRIDYIKLPCLARTIEGEYAVKYLDLGYKETVELRSNLITSAIIDFAPDLVLVDKKPLGVENELAPALDLVRRRGHGCKFVLLLRDILDEAPVTQRIWDQNRYHEAIEAYYDEILVVGSRRVFDVGAEYGFPPGSRSKVSFCGYIGRRSDRPSPVDVRTELKFDDGPMVLVTAGGGGDGFNLVSSYVRGLHELGPAQRIQSLVVCGPELPANERRALQDLAAGVHRLVVKDFHDDMLACISASDLVVSMAGYNTICELLSAKKRAIIVPRVRPVKEQWIRAERLSQLGIFRSIHPAYLTPQRLLDAVQQELADANVRRPLGFDQIDLEGLPRIERSINNLLSRGHAAEFVPRRARA